MVALKVVVVRVEEGQRKTRMRNVTNFHGCGMTPDLKAKNTLSLAMVFSPGIEKVIAI